MFYALVDNEKKIFDQVNLFVALAPVMQMGHSNSVSLKLICENIDLLEGAVEELDIYEFFGVQAVEKWHKFQNSMVGIMLNSMKALMLKMVDSGSYSDKERALAESRVFPNISSIKEAIHYCQMVHAGTF